MDKIVIDYLSGILFFFTNAHRFVSLLRYVITNIPIVDRNPQI